MAKAQMLQMQEDMQKIHEKHVKLLKDLDDNYKLIEEETQEQFNEFLDKWKKLAKDKIDHYKSSLRSLKQEKENMRKEMQGTITELQDKNKKLINDYEKLLDKYKNDTEAEKRQNREKAELMESAYEEEFSRLKQDKIKLEELLDAIKSQKENYEQQALELRRKMRHKNLEAQETIRAITDNYTADCAILVMNHVVDAVELQISKESYEKSKVRIEMLGECMKDLEKQKEVLREQIRKSSASVEPAGRKLVQLKVIKSKGEDSKRYNRLIKGNQIEESKKQLNESSTVNDSVISIRSNDHRKRSISPITKVSDRSFVSMPKSLAKINELKKEIETLKAELQKTRLAATKNLPETEIIRQLKEEIKSLNRYKETAESSEKEDIKERLMRLSTKSQSSLRENVAKGELEHQGQQRLIHKLEPLQSKMMEVEGRLEEREKELSKLGKEHVHLTREYNVLKDKLIETENILNKERCISEALRIEVDKVAKKYDQFNEKDTKNFEEQLKKAQAQYEQELASTKKTLTTEIEKLSKELKIVKAEATKLKETNKSLGARKNELEEKLQAVSKNAEYKASEAETLKAKVNTYEGQIVKLRTDILNTEKDYQDEILQRKRLHNLIEEMKGNIRVYCRIRPPATKDAVSVVKIVDRFTVKANTIQGPKTFLFDAVFDPEATQEEVFEYTKPLIQSGIDGYNVCIFAYGQTGTGKTYTIQGTQTQPGIAPRGFEEMEKVLGTMSNCTYSMECYMVELYNNTLSDLLDTEDSKKNPSHLQIKEDIKKMIYIEGVKKQTINTAKEAKEIFEKGLRNRKTSATEKNDNSSRSHLIFTILIETVNRQTSQRTLGKISFVDLAGSERAESAAISTGRLKETGFINKSLFALNNVIATLAPAHSLMQSNIEAKRVDKSFAPYRDSKLTMLMRDSIGGNVKFIIRDRQKLLCL